MPNPPKRIREIAAKVENPVMRSELEALAAEFENQHNKQNGDWAVVIGNIENHLTAQIVSLQKEQGHSKQRQEKMLKLLESLQLELRALSGREVGGNASD